MIIHLDIYLSTDFLRIAITRKIVAVMRQRKCEIYLRDKRYGLNKLIVKQDLF